MVEIQVYGGGVSIILGSYVWSTSSFNGRSVCVAGVTNVSNLSLIFDDCRFADSIAVTSAIKGEKLLLNFVTMNVGYG